VEDIIQLAERLGRAIADSPQAAKLDAARQGLDGEPGMSQLVKDYDAQARKIAQLEEKNQPIEVEDKHRLEELHNKLTASEAFKKFTGAQVEYVDLMRKVNAAIRRNIGETDQARKPASSA
jgi:cell fate (sporulation/competence/biofilm development) regulator YlbF (YheA/YmcA/DUF963 family)